MEELGEDGKYEVITRAMRPLLFGEFTSVPEDATFGPQGERG